MGSHGTDRDGKKDVQVSSSFRRQETMVSLSTPCDHGNTAQLERLPQKALVPVTATMGKQLTQRRCYGEAHSLWPPPLTPFGHLGR